MEPRAGPVGRLIDGRPVHGVRIGVPGGLEAQVWDYGAAIATLHVPLPGGDRAQVLPNPPGGLAGLEADGGYHARVIGRVANRIGGARFTLDGREHRTDPNENGSTLHGGREGWHDKLWRFESAEAESCTLAYDCPDGKGGFPGAVEARVHVAVTGGDTLEITWAARAHAPTPLAMTHHLYFNLAGREGAATLDHRLRIAASAVTAVDARLIPTGELLAVEGGVLDLRAGRAMAELARADHPQLKPGGGMDLNYVLDRGEEALTLSCPASGLAMHVSTDQPGCQVYGGQGLQAPMTRYGGVAIEPQDFPDAVNRPRFPDVILRPGTAYRRTARYRFARDEGGFARDGGRLARDGG